MLQKKQPEKSHEVVDFSTFIECGFGHIDFVPIRASFHLQTLARLDFERRMARQPLIGPIYQGTETKNTHPKSHI